jgi:SAM-dependent methyltransferase
VQDDDFLNIALTAKRLDRYVVRSSILKAVDWILPECRGTMLDIGCGEMPYRSYIVDRSAVEQYLGVDIESDLGYQDRVKPDRYWDGRVIPIEDGSINVVFCTEVLEHVPDTLSFLKEARRVLKPGGLFFFTTPFLWPLHDVPYDEYRFTPYAIERFFAEAGFQSWTVKPLGGWHASLAQMLGLWVNRSKLSARSRKFLRRIIKPIMRRLIDLDRTTDHGFSESAMITGLYGSAKK